MPRKRDLFVAMSSLPAKLRVHRRRWSRRKPKVGAVPGELAFAPESETKPVAKTKLRVIQYDAKSHRDRWVDSLAEFDTVDPSLTPDLVTWIDVPNVDDLPTLEAIGKRFDLHPLALEDVVHVFQHAKLERYGETLFFVARMPIGNEGFQTEQVSLFVVGNVVITMQERDGDCLDPVRERIAKSLGRIRTRRADYLAYAIIDAIIDGYFPAVERFETHLTEVAKMLRTTNSNNDLPMHLHHIRADLLLIRKTVQQHRDALRHLLREGDGILAEDTRLYLRDCQDHIGQLMEAADTDRETCGELRELYFAMISQKNNDVMKVLTIIATLFIPMTFVAGIYGMNFDPSASPMNMPELEWAFGYPFALAVMLLLAVGLLAFLYRKGWLS